MLGPYDRFAKLLRQDLEIELFTRRGNLRLKGGDEDVQEAKRRIEHLLGKSRKGRELQVSEIEAILLGGDGAVSENGARAAQSAARVAGGRAASPYRVVRPGLAGSERSAGTEEGGGSGMRPRLLHSSSAGARGLRVSPVEPRTENQRRYLDLIEKSPLVFGSGRRGRQDVPRGRGRRPRCARGRAAGS